MPARTSTHWPNKPWLRSRAFARVSAEPLPYARIDLIRAENGTPQLLELELTEPSLFFAHAPGSAERFAATVLAARLSSENIRTRTGSA